MEWKRFVLSVLLVTVLERIGIGVCFHVSLNKDMGSVAEALQSEGETNEGTITVIFLDACSRDGRGHREIITRMNNCINVDLGKNHDTFTTKPVGVNLRLFEKENCEEEITDGKKAKIVSFKVTGLA